LKNCSEVGLKAQRMLRSMNSIYALSSADSYIHRLVYTHIDTSAECRYRLYLTNA